MVFWFSIQVARYKLKKVTNVVFLFSIQVTRYKLKKVTNVIFAYNKEDIYPCNSMTGYLMSFFG